MKISYTELNDLLLKVFEGLKFSQGDNEDLAHAISWLEFHNWPILANTLEIAQLPQQKQANISFEDSHSTTIAVEKNIAFMAGSLSLDLAYVKSKMLGGTAVEVALLNPILPELHIPNLPHIAQRGYAAQLVWHVGQEQVIQAKIEPMSKLPTIRNYTGEKLPVNLALFVEVGTTVNQYSPPLGITEVTEINPMNLENRFRENIATGFELDDTLWRTMKTLAQKSLVEATEESRSKGAGEAA